MPKKINVYVMTYNRSDFLLETIDSILHQSYHDYELYILDNCSTDDTAQIAAEIQDKRVHYIRHEENLGGAGNFNFALDHCQADYFVVFHDDDIMLPDFLQKEIDVLETDDQIAAVGGNAEKFGAVSDPQAIRQAEKKRLFQGREFITRYLQSGETFVFPSVMYRNAFIQKHHIRLHTEPGPCGDLVFLAEIERKGGTLCQLQDVVMRYRMHPNQDSSLNYISMHIRLYDYLKSCPEYREIFEEEKEHYTDRYLAFSKNLLSRWVRGMISDKETEQFYRDLKRVLLIQKDGKWTSLFYNCQKYPVLKKTVQWMYKNRIKMIAKG